ncbi:MAG: N-acetyltransferase [Sphingopyxis sp.]
MQLVEIKPLSSVESPQVEAVLDAAFGADRHGRTAYRVREGVSALSALSFAAFHDGRLVGTLQSWPVMLVADDGASHPLVMVGPVAVIPVAQAMGVGRSLMRSLLSAADTDANAALMMIGDPGYYGRFFGFTAVATGGWELPGPLERNRLLARGVGAHLPPACQGRIVPQR